VPLAARALFGRAALPFGASIGAVAGLAFAFHWRSAAPWRPDEFGSGWMHVVWAAALTAGVIASLLPAWWNCLPKLAAVAVSVYVTLPEDRRDGPWWFIVLAGAMAIPWLAAPQRNSAPKQWPERSVLLAFALAAMSVVALCAHYLRITDFAMMSACAMAGGAAACSLLGRDCGELEGLGYLSLPAMAFLVWNDVESAIPPAGILCAGLAAAPMTTLRWLPSHGLRSRMYRGAIVLIPSAIAVIIAMSFEELSFG